MMRLLINLRNISQIIGCISIVLKKLHKCFNGTAISISLVLAAVGGVLVIIALSLNHAESVLIFLKYSFKNTSRCFCIIFAALDNKSACQHPDLLHYLFSYYFILFMQSLNGAKFLNAICSLL